MVESAGAAASTDDGPAGAARIVLRARLTAAMKAKDRPAVAALRSALGAIDNAEALPVAATDRTPAVNEHVAGTVAGIGAAEATRRMLGLAEVRAVLGAEITDRRNALAAFPTDNDRAADRAEYLRREIAVLEAALAAVLDAVRDTGREEFES